MDDDSDVCLAIPYQLKATTLSNCTIPETFIFKKMTLPFKREHTKKCNFRSLDNQQGIAAARPLFTADVIRQIRMENSGNDFSRRFWRERVATFYLIGL